MADSFTPPQSVRDAAALGLKLRRKHGRGGTEVGVARARDLANGRGIFLVTIRRMASFFARHDNDTERAARKRDDTSAAAIAWLLWGGDPGRRWVSGVLDRVGKGWGAQWVGALATLAKSAPDVGEVHSPGPIGNADSGASQTPPVASEPDPAELAMGIRVEGEHGGTIADAERIAREHIARVPDYYSRLKAAGLVKSVSMVAKLADTDDDQRIAYYVASVAEEADGTVVVDRQQDMISPDELERTAHNFLTQYRRIGDRHQRWGGVGEVVASFVTTRELQKSLSSLPGASSIRLPVAWVLGIHVTDEAIWQEVKGGTLEAMSIGGSAVRVEAE